MPPRGVAWAMDPQVIQFIERTARVGTYPVAFAQWDETPSEEAGGARAERELIPTRRSVGARYYSLC